MKVVAVEVGEHRIAEMNVVGVVLHHALGVALRERLVERTNDRGAHASSSCVNSGCFFATGSELDESAAG